MSIQTDLSVSPYFDDYSDAKDYYKILFRPGVAVQARELNQLQTILQRQIERFGNNIFKQGTVIDGCDIAFHPELQYVKIKDVQPDSSAVDVSLYKNYRIKNQNDITPLEAFVLETNVGFESTYPDLNTLYVRYINTGFASSGIANTANGQHTFSAGDTLTVFNPLKPIEKINIDPGGGSQGFSAGDKVVILSAIAVQNTTGGTFFANNYNIGDYVSDGTANVVITAIDTTTYNDKVVFRIRPRIEDLKAGDTSKWTLYANTSIERKTEPKSSVAVVKSLIGQGASATITRSALGEVTGINMAQKGSGYDILPNISIASLNASVRQIGSFSASPQTHLATLTVAPGQYQPVGNSYGMTVGEGVIYQKGYFSRVSEQLVIVEKYNSAPDAKSVGFETVEDVINSNQDTSLLDNATGAPNYAAPGANRLKLTPTLSVITKAEADSRTDWLYVAEFSNGNPYKQNRQTVYNVIGKQIDRRFNESAGNYSTNPFLVSTKFPRTFVEEANTFNVFIDPGVAFINGSRVETVLNYEAPIRKGNDTKTVTNASISLNFGNYVEVNQLGGYFLFKTGDRVALYDTAKTYLSAAATVNAATPAPTGNLIGYARIRSLVYDRGVPGTPSCVYRLYLFDINMNIGKNFTSVKSIFYDGTVKAICDTILDGGLASIKDNTKSSLIYYAGNPAIVNASSVSYVYRTSDTLSISASGRIVVSAPSGGSQEFPYNGGDLSLTQKEDIIVVPLANSEPADTAVLTGTVTAATTSTSLNGSSTLFLSEVKEGDFVKFTGTASLGQVASIANNTCLYLTANSAATVTANTYKLFFPANVPIPINRDGRPVTVTGDQKQMTIELAYTPLIAGVPMAVTYNVRQKDVVPVAKTVNRGRFARLCLANNVATSTGPWSLGVGDAIRLKNVYLGSNGTFGASELNVTQNFYIDHNQTEDYYGISYLYRKPGTALNLSTADWLLVELDHLSHGSEGLKAPGGSGTYNINDGVELASATTTINTVEIPEVFGTRGNYYDLRDQFDFRPSANNTTTLYDDPSLAPLNPPEQTAASRFNTADKKFPAPDSDLTATISYYVGRTDRIIIDETSEFRVIEGTPGAGEPPIAPDNALSLNILKIPPYPSLPYQLSPQMVQYVDTGIANEKYTTRRLNSYRVTTAQTDTERAQLQPRGYTMKDIGKLERRIAELEYYTSLTLTELQAQKRVIPGVDGADRFKFGFFVDGFENYTYSDVSNPAYSATIVDGYLSPLIREVNVGMTTLYENNGTLPFVEVNYISQSRATDGPLVANTLPATTQIITNVVQEQRNRNNSGSGYVYEEFFYTFSSKAGPAEFYINSKNNDVAAEISQSDTPDGPWTTTYSSRNAEAITSSDIYTKQLSLNGGREIQHPGSLQPKSYPQGSNFFYEDQFKLQWQHNPDNGVYIRVRVYKGKRHGGFLGTKGGDSGTFGYKMFFPIDTTVNQVQTEISTNYLLAYGGIAIPNFWYY